MRNKKCLPERVTFFRFIWLIGAILTPGVGQNVFAFDAGTIKGTARAVTAANSNGAATADSAIIAGVKLTLVNKGGEDIIK